MDRDIKLDFLVSALHKGCFISTEDILQWMEKRNEETAYSLEQVPLKSLKGWNDANDCIAHDSGKFFTICKHVGFF